MRLFFLALVATSLVACACANEEKAVPLPPATPVFAFGDSAVDIGNVAAIVGRQSSCVDDTCFQPAFAPYAKGRFSNGPVFPELLAEKLGTGALKAYGKGPKAGSTFKDFYNGVSFGTIGSGYIAATSAFGVTNGLKSQVSQFQSLIGGGYIYPTLVSKALYVIWSGSDEFVAATNGLSQPAGAKDYAPVVRSTLTSTVLDLFKAGARNFVIAGLPALGCSPSAVTVSGGQVTCDAAINAAVTETNKAISAAIRHLRRTKSTLNIVYLDVYSITEGAEKFHFTFPGACCGSGKLFQSNTCAQTKSGKPNYHLCTTAGAHAWFDAFHFSTKFHSRLAALAYDGGRAYVKPRSVKVALAEGVNLLKTTISLMMEDQPPSHVFPAGKIFDADAFPIFREQGIAFSVITIEECGLFGPVYLANAASYIFMQEGSAYIGMANGYNPFAPPLSNTTSLRTRDFLAVPLGWPFFIYATGGTPVKLAAFHKISRVGESLDWGLGLTGGAWVNIEYDRFIAAAEQNITKTQLDAFVPKLNAFGIVKTDPAICAKYPPPPALTGTALDGGVEGDYILHGNEKIALARLPFAISRDCTSFSFPELALVGLSALFPTMDPGSGIVNHYHPDTFEVNYGIEGNSNTLASFPNGTVISDGTHVEVVGELVVVPPSYPHSPIAYSEQFSFVSFFTGAAPPTNFFNGFFNNIPKLGPVDILAQSFQVDTPTYLANVDANTGSFAFFKRFPIDSNGPTL
eukprot:jgi/Chlat1/8144/Chrsp76S00610